MKPLKTKSIFPLIVLVCLSASSICGQQVIHLDNPSFEDTPRRGTSIPQPIDGWIDCGSIAFPKESGPDIHPTPESSWNVSQQAYHGKTYIGLVTRDNGSFEYVSQNLRVPLEAGKCYELKAYLSTASGYQSATSLNLKKIQSFANPVVLEIWGGTFYCHNQQLLARSTPVNHPEWREYTLTLVPEVEINSITMAVFYHQREHHQPYNGHILIDHLSAITEIPCDE